MSGPKRHYIPQALLRGFGLQAKNKKGTQVVVYFSNGRIISTNTKNVGVEKNFYPDSIDEKITDYEGKKLSKTLEKFRLAPIGSQVDREEAVEMIVHLCLRQAELSKVIAPFLKQILGEAANKFFLNRKIFELVGAAFTQGQLRKKLLDKFHAQANSKILSKIPRFVADIIIIYIIRRLMRKHINDEFVGKTSILIRRAEFDRKYLSQIDGIARNQQMQTLEENLIPQKRIELLDGFIWKMEAAPFEGAVLPDCIALYSSKRANFGSPAAIDPKKAIMIYLPIAHDKILVGRRGRARFYAIPSNINEAAAASSHSFFVARDRLPVFTDSITKIGTRFKLLSEKLLRDASKEFDKSASKVHSSFMKRIHPQLQSLPLFHHDPKLNPSK